MTNDMAFECLLISRDPGVVCVVNKFLDGLSISTDVCFTSSQAVERLAKGTTDLIVLDCDDESDDLLRQLRQSHCWHKPTVLAVSAAETPVVGAHVMVRKPLTGESCAQSLRSAYMRMLRDHRRHARYVLMIPVTAMGQDHRLVPVTVMDIGDGGVGLMTRELLAVGEVLSLRLLLPGSERSISIEARVRWTRQYGAVGCEFVRIPPVDLSILHEWLKAKCQVKKPVVEV